MQNILIAINEFRPEHIERIRESVRPWANVEAVTPSDVSPGEFRSHLLGKDIVVGAPQPEWLLGTSVRFLQIGWSGWDLFEGKGLKEQGVIVCSARGLYAIPVAEHCLSMMFALARRLPRHVLDKNEKIFCRRPPYREISGSTACIIGLGNIGLALASRCRCLGMRVIGVARQPERPYLDVEKTFSFHDLKSVVAEADHIFVTVSGNAANKELLNRHVLEAIRPMAYFYNVSRGSTVDEVALCDLLAQGRIAGAGIDVTVREPLPADSPLWSLGDDVLITGHSAGLTDNWCDRFCGLVSANLARFRRGEPLENRVI